MSAISRWRSCVFLCQRNIHLWYLFNHIHLVTPSVSCFVWLIEWMALFSFDPPFGQLYQRIRIDINTCTHTHVELNRCIDGRNIKICNNFLTSLSYCVFVFLQKFQINSKYFSEFLSNKSVQSKPVRISSKFKQNLMYNRYIQGFWIKQDKDVYVHAYICIFIVCTKTGAPKKVKAWSRKGECYSQFSWRQYYNTTYVHMCLKTCKNKH